MAVEEAILPIMQALNAEYATNRISYESTTQWLNELGVMKSKKESKEIKSMNLRK
jgi:hypothetical protein